jgi:signal transduction histidine kinase
VFLALVAVKITNPIHGHYFRTEIVATPFPHLGILNQPLHWLAMAFAYALASVGYFMLLELFWKVDHNSTPLVALIGITGLPVILDVLALASPLIIDITYEPLGVAAFAVGVLYGYLDDLQAIQLAGEQDDPTIVLDDDGHIRDYNSEAAELFPALEPEADLAAVAPKLASHVESDTDVLELDRSGGLGYYQLSVNPFTTAQTSLGRAITLTDITEREQYRNEVERQNDRLEQFASMVSHDLRNPLTVALGRLEAARKDADNEHLVEVDTALNRMETLIDDLLTLARQGQPIDETHRVMLSTLANRCWGVVDTKNASLTVDTDQTILADEGRLQQLFENLFRNAIEHGGDDVAIHVGALSEAGGFYIEDDGPGIPQDKREDVLESGFTTNQHGTGFGLSIVSEIVDAHGWRIRVTESESGGARFEITGVEFADSSAVPNPAD